MERVKNYQFENGEYYFYFDSDYLRSIYIYRLDETTSTRGTHVVQEGKLIRSIITMKSDDTIEYLDTWLDNEFIQTYKFDKKQSVFYKLTEDEALLILSEGI